MDKKFWIYVILFVTLVTAFISWRLYNYSPPEDILSTKITKEINQLEKKIDNLKLERDSLQSIIDTTRVEVIKIHEEYNKVRTNIIYQPIDSDIIFFSRYVADNEGLLNNDYSETIENY